METGLILFDIPQDVPPPLEHAAELLRGIVQTAAKSPRNGQKVLHLVSRGMEILESLRIPFQEPPLDFDDLINATEKLRKLELMLMEARHLVDQEAAVQSSEESKASWATRRKELNDLLIEAHSPEFNPPANWEKDLDEVKRMDDHLWAGSIAHDVWKSKADLKVAKDVERIAVKVLEPKSRADIENYVGIEKAMEWWKLGHQELEPAVSSPAPPDLIELPPSSPSFPSDASSLTEEEEPVLLAVMPEDISQTPFESQSEEPAPTAESPCTTTSSEIVTTLSIPSSGVIAAQAVLAQPSTTPPSIHREKDSLRVTWFWSFCNLILDFLLAAARFLASSLLVAVIAAVVYVVVGTVLLVVVELLLVLAKVLLVLAQVFLIGLCYFGIGYVLFSFVISLFN